MPPQNAKKAQRGKGKEQSNHLILSIPIVPKSKIQDKFQISFCKKHKYK